MLASLREVLIKPSGLFHIDPYLIDIDQEAIFVLISHNKYKKNRDDAERRVSDIYTVFGAEASPRNLAGFHLLPGNTETEKWDGRKTKPPCCMLTYLLSFY